MKTAFSILIIFFLGVTGAFCSEKPDIDRDLAEVRTSIKNAQEQASNYAGGLILAQIKLREQILKTTEAMLEQKRSSWVYKIHMSYVIQGQTVRQATKEELSDIEADIQRVRKEITDSKAEAEQYSGGLILAMKLSAIATKEVTLCALQQKYYAAKYGIPLLALDNSEGTFPTKGVPQRPGKPVKDEDAL